MLQIFHLNISKVDLVLHVLQWHRWLVTTFSLSANSLIRATTLSWSPAALALDLLG
jgi:hypothetical protein